MVPINHATKTSGCILYLQAYDFCNHEKLFSDQVRCSEQIRKRYLEKC